MSEYIGIPPQVLNRLVAAVHERENPSDDLVLLNSSLDKLHGLLCQIRAEHKLNPFSEDPYIKELYGQYLAHLMYFYDRNKELLDDLYQYFEYVEIDKPEKDA